MTPETPLVRFTLDGRTVQGPQGAPLLQWCLDSGYPIPHYCYHPGIGVDGNCRMCLVEMKGARGPVISCATVIQEGMEIRTDTPTLRALREQVLEFYLTNHPLDCPFCDKGGECPLQDYTIEHHKGGSRFTVEKNHGVKHQRLGDHIMFDSERCILCTRCVRYYRDVLGDEPLGVRFRGSHSEISLFGDRPLGHGLSGNLADFCPVGALTSIEYRFVARPWELVKETTACAHCAVGCPTLAWRKQNAREILRLTAHQDASGGHFWMCDEGRYYPNRIRRQGRLAHPMTARGEEIGWADAAARVRAAGAAEASAWLASPQWTAEEMETLATGGRTLVSMLGQAQLDFLREAWQAGWMRDTSRALDESDLMIEWASDPESWVGSVYRLRLRAAQRRRMRPWLARTASALHRNMNVTMDAGARPADFLTAHPEARDVVVVIDEGFQNAEGLSWLRALAAQTAQRGGRLAVAPLLATANAMDQVRRGLPSWEKADLRGPLFIGLIEAAPPGLLQRLKDSPDWMGAFSVQPPFADPTHSPAPVQLYLPTPTFYEKSGTFTNLAGEERRLTAATRPPENVPSVADFLLTARKSAHGYGIPVSGPGQNRPATA